MNRLERFFGIPPTLSQDLRSNMVHMYFDITWWGIYTGSTAAFLLIYAARIGATATQIGLLTALPSAVMLGLSLPAGRVLHKYSARKATVLSTFASRLLFLSYALLPWLLAPHLQVQAILWLSVIIAVPTTVVSISFNQNFMDIIPSDWRGTVVGMRYAILAVMSFIVTLACGQILTRLPFPGSYQVVFLLGFAGAIMTVYHISRSRPVPETNPQVAAMIAAETSQPEVRRPWWQLPGNDERSRHFIKVLFFLFVFNIGNSIVAPLVPNLLVHTLNLSDAMISVGTAASSMLMFVSSLLIARILRRTGNRPATALGIVLLAGQAFGLAFARDATLFLVAAAFGGIATGFLGAAAYSYTVDNVPMNGRPVWLAWNVMLSNLAVLLGALAGPALAGVVSVPWALAAFGVFRLAVGIALYFWG